MLEGELEIMVEGVPHSARPGIVAVVPANARHSVRAVAAGRMIVIDHPARREFG